MERKKASDFPAGASGPVRWLCSWAHGAAAPSWTGRKVRLGGSERGRAVRDAEAQLRLGE